jgi:hypothetical protein
MRGVGMCAERVERGGSERSGHGGMSIEYRRDMGCARSL